MPQDTHPAVAPNAQVELLRLAVLDIIDECTDFAAEVEEIESECGCMSLLTIQQHLSYLRAKARELGGRVQ